MTLTSFLDEPLPVDSGGLGAIRAASSRWMVDEVDNIPRQPRPTPELRVLLPETNCIRFRVMQKEISGVHQVEPSSLAACADKP